MPVSQRATALLPVLLVLGVLVGTSAGAELQNGVYEGLVVGVRQGTPEPADGNAFVEEVTAFLNAGSDALSHALDGRASFGAVRLIIPRDWDKTKFTSVLPPPAKFNFRDSVDILLHDDPDTLPDTLQSEQCGVPGRQIEVPVSFLSLTTEEEGKYGTTGHILAHEWAHYRWGAQDEHGNRMDAVYDGAYQVENGNALVTSCYAGELRGAWRPDCSSAMICNPASLSDKTKPCYFCIDGAATPATTQASLGYLPALSTGKFCDAVTHNSHSPSPQNILCGGRSITEVINAHPDAQSLAAHSPAPVTLTVHEEPLGLVVIALDTPPLPEGEVLSYEELLTALQGPLTGTPARQHVSVLSYRALADEVEFYNDRLFDPITTETYGELRGLLPSEEARAAPPDLSSVFKHVLKTYGSLDYDGVLLVLPVTDDLLAASKLDAALGESMRTGRIKPLLLFPESTPSLASVAPFLQEAGARFLYRNSSTGPVDYAATAAGDEVMAFVTRPFMNDHPILYHESVVLAQGESYNHTVFYQGVVSEHLMAVVTTTGVVSDLSVSHVRWGDFTDCLGTRFCTALPESVVYIKKNEKVNLPGEEWALQVTNNGPPATVDVKWTAVNFVGQDEELEVVVWWSDGRGPVADVDQNGRLVLYASITNRGYVVPSSRVTVLADVEVTPPGGPAQILTGLVLEDNGEGVDIRSEDSVYSYGFPEQVFAKGTDATVLGVQVVNIPFSTQGKASTRASSSAGAQARRQQSSGLFPLDPQETECCGSYVKNPNVEMNFQVKGFNLVSKKTFETVTLTRTIVPRAESTTTAAGTTATTTVAAGTEAITTAAAGTEATTTGAAGTAATTTAAAGTAATTTAAAGTAAPPTKKTTTEAPITITEPPTEEDPAIKELRQLSIAAISLASVAIAVQVAGVTAFLLCRGRAGV